MPKLDGILETAIHTEDMVRARANKYLSEHSLIKAVFEETLSLPAPNKA